jgi:hypothetical protein
MNKHIATVIGVVVVSVVGLIAYLNAPTPTTQQAPVGAVSSPDISSRYFSYGGVRHWAAKTTSLTQATTTVCALQSPSATSTLQLGSGIRFDVSSTTASVVKLAKASVPFDVSSTQLGAANVGANQQATIVASSTSDNLVFGPNQYLIVQMSGGTGTFSPSGNCQATWTEI